MIPENEPKLSGILPVRKLWSNLTAFNFVRLPIDEGIDPVKALKESSMKFSSRLSNMGGIAPVRFKNARRSCWSFVSLEIVDGIGPLMLSVQQSVVDCDEARSSGLLNDALICKRTFLSSGLHSSPAAAEAARRERERREECSMASSFRKELW
ncbi:hypothetical protein Drorol1_Dr00019500 [Drosera rotundifolia]